MFWETWVTWRDREMLTRSWAPSWKSTLTASRMNGPSWLFQPCQALRSFLGQYQVEQNCCPAELSQPIRTTTCNAMVTVLHHWVLGCFVMKQERTKPLLLSEDRTTGPVISKPVLFLMSDDYDVVFSTTDRNGLNPLASKDDSIWKQDNPEKT